MSSGSIREQAHRRQKQALIGLLLLAIAGLGAYLFFTPWVSKDIDIGFSEEARRKPYLAAEEFLQRFEISVRTENGLALLDNLPPSDDTILIASSRRSLSERRVTGLIEWVESGGTLLLLANDLYDEDREDKGDLLLDRFGLSLYEGEPERAYEPEVPERDQNPSDFFAGSEGVNRPEEQPQKQSEKQKETLADVFDALKATSENCSDRTDASVTRLSLGGEPQELVVEMSSNRHLYFEASKDYPYASNDIGAQFVYVSHGQGNLYVLTSLDLWRNRNIGCFDHAHVLRVLAEDAPNLWLLFNTDIEPIHKLLWKRWPIAIALTLTWLALWFWRSAYRTTRVDPDAPKERRELMEHIVGMSRFLYQQNEVGLLLSALRKDCLGTTALAAKKDKLHRSRIKHWATLLKVDEQNLDWALTAKISKDSKDLTRAVALLQRVRKLRETNNT